MPSSVARLRFVVTLVAALGSASGCGGESPITIPEQPAACNGPIAVSVSSGVTPSFDWSPRCGVSNILVTKSTPAGDSLVWAVNVAESIRMGGPITYGKTPSFATEGVRARTLIPNAQYSVRVYMTIGLDVETGGGSKTFSVPSPTL